MPQFDQLALTRKNLQEDFVTPIWAVGVFTWAKPWDENSLITAVSDEGWDTETYSLLCHQHDHWQIASAQHASEIKTMTLTLVHCFGIACWLQSRRRGKSWPCNTRSFCAGCRRLTRHKGQSLCILFPIFSTVSLCSFLILCLFVVKKNPNLHRLKIFCI